MNEKTKRAIKTIYNYLAISDRPQKADAIFVAASFSLDPPEKAAKLYKMGYARYVVVVGIEGTFSDLSWKEGQLVTYKKKLLEYGVPESAIIAEPLAPNSLEEALKSIPLMKKHGINPKKVIIVDRPEHQRREWATFTRQWPRIKFINCPAQEFLSYSQKTLDILVAEIERLKKYAKKGNIIVQKFPEEVLEAWKFLGPKVIDKF